MPHPRARALLEGLEDKLPALLERVAELEKNAKPRSFSRRQEEMSSLWELRFNEYRERALKKQYVVELP